MEDEESNKFYYGNSIGLMIPMSSVAKTESSDIDQKGYKEKYEKEWKMNKDKYPVNYDSEQVEILNVPEEMLENYSSDELADPLLDYQLW